MQDIILGTRDKTVSKRARVFPAQWADRYQSHLAFIHSYRKLLWYSILRLLCYTATWLVSLNTVATHIIEYKTSSQKNHPSQVIISQKMGITEAYD